MGEVHCLHAELNTRQGACPILLMAGGRGMVSIQEAIKLQADCGAADIDVELAIPRMISPPVGEIENFVTLDDSVFGWLGRKLEGHRPRAL